MKKIFLITRSCFFSLFLISCVKPVLATNYYFSSSSGDDSRPKSSAGQPWKSINKLNSIFSQLNPGDSILLKCGDTFYGTVNVNASGLSDKPIVLASYGKGHKPVITSLKTISDWKATDQKNIYACHVEVANRLQVVLLDNEPQRMGRYPNSGYSYIDSHKDSTSITDNKLTSAPDWIDAELVLRRERWVLDRFPVLAINNKTISYKNAKSNGKDGYGYFIQNALSTLDSDGEWFYDNKSESFYMYLDKNPKSKNIQIASVDNLITSKGYNYLNFYDLTLDGSNLNGFDINSSENISVINCNIQHAGRDGIRGTKCKNLTVDNSFVSNCYNDGINVLGSSSSLIKNNVVKNTYMIAGLGGSGNVKGAGIRNGKDGVITNNKIVNSGYIGIQLGGGNEIIMNNIIDSFCLVKDDGGGIYAVKGKQNITYTGKVAGNIISNGIGAGEGTTKTPVSSAEGIYMDGGVSGVEITGNTITATHWGIYLHNAFDITVANNTLYNNGVQFYAKHDKTHAINNINFSGNKLIAQKPDEILIGLVSSEDDIKSFGSFEKNFYKAQNVGNMFLIQYKAAGMLVRDKPTISMLKQNFGFESAASEDILNNKIIGDADFKIFTNVDSKPKEFALDRNYRDQNNSVYQNSIEVAPYTSIVLFRK
ncbi:MAG: right-handed parallel beta-helix repeat-containing protein [Ginsengibacter sp.]